MGYQFVFKRHEVKYLLTPEQLAVVRRAMEPHMRPDEYGRSTLCNVYYDTPDHLLIRRSLEHPLYKEKLRVRSYGVAGPDSPAFIEIKKKYRRTVYKRRVGTTEANAEALLAGAEPLPDGQIWHEVAFFLGRYGTLVPSVHLSYERQAFFDREDREFRMTFDENVLWRDHDLALTAPIGGEPLLPEGRTLMEVKAGGAFPLWVAQVLSENGIFPARFSKYGRAYQVMQARRDEFATEAKVAALPLGGREAPGANAPESTRPPSAWGRAASTVRAPQGRRPRDVVNRRGLDKERCA